MTIVLAAAMAVGLPLTAQGQGDSASTGHDGKLGSAQLASGEFTLANAEAGRVDAMVVLDDHVQLKRPAGREDSGQPPSLSIPIPSSDYLAMTLDWECSALKPPKRGWGQGVLFKFMGDDATSPLFTLGYVATRNSSSGVVVWPQGAETAVVRETVPTPLEFQRGVWLVQRDGRQLILSLSTSGVSFREILRTACSDSSISRFEISPTSARDGVGPLECAFYAARVLVGGVIPEPPADNGSTFATVIRWCLRVIVLAVVVAVAYVAKLVWLG
ncbi:MAG: hypothetical protein KDA61_21710 [Planctomycetales bacterium]|nr:hypothetical protein [Planctomycetales bacterium]